MRERRKLDNIRTTSQLSLCPVIIFCQTATTAFQIDVLSYLLLFSCSVMSNYFATPWAPQWDPMEPSRLLCPGEWVAIPFSGWGSSQPSHWICVSCTGRQILHLSPSHPSGFSVLPIDSPRAHCILLPDLCFKNTDLSISTSWSKFQIIPFIVLIPVRKIPWRRKWQPTPVFLPGKSHGQRSLVGYSPWGHKRVGHNLGTERQQQASVTWVSKWLGIF